jgi:hypothetical protein
MSVKQDEIALIGEAWREWNETGVNAVARFLHQEIEWIDPPQLPGAETHLGREAVTTFLREWEGTMRVVSLSFEVEEIIPAGDDYLVVSAAEGVSEGGVPIPPHHWFHLIRIEDGLLRRAQLFLDREEAMNAAGLSE